MGHVVRLEDGRWLREILNWLPIAEKRRSERPRKRWDKEARKVCGLGREWQTRVGRLITHSCMAR